MTVVSLLFITLICHNFGPTNTFNTVLIGSSLCSHIFVQYFCGAPCEDTGGHRGTNVKCVSCSQKLLFMSKPPNLINSSPDCSWVSWTASALYSGMGVIPVTEYPSKLLYSSACRKGSVDERRTTLRHVVPGDSLRYKWEHFLILLEHVNILKHYWSTNFVQFTTFSLVICHREVICGSEILN